ncbi:MAG: LysR substrate-binding domain-containing protein [Bacteroidales bacterium]|jgi:DNA-binding transcriptional LysR family regulator|nr:LysR substrate-binding domain-containing protein [Bacteroidales bacterium]
MIDLRHLKYFMVLAEELHFGRAAEKLFISQPPLSRQIKQLEELLGVPLFIRNNKKVELTRFGSFLKAEGEKIFTEMLQLEKNIQLMKVNDEGTVRIGYVGAVMFSVFKSIFVQLKSAFPKLQFVLNELNNESQIDGLRRNMLDIGFIRGPLDVNDLSYYTIEQSSFSIIISANHELANKESIALCDLATEPFIQFSKICAPPLHKSIDNIFTNENIEPLVVHETSQFSALVRLVESGFGYSIVPTNLEQGFDIGVKYFDIPNCKEKTEIGMIHNSKYKTMLLDNIIDRIRSM